MTRRALTPIGDELEHPELEVGKPSLRDRWRRRRRMIPTPRHWWGWNLFGLLQFAIALTVAVGLALAIAGIGGWTDRAAMSKVFIIVGGALIALMGAGALTSGRRDVAAPYGTSVVLAEVGGNRIVAWSIAWFLVGGCLLGIGFYLDATK